jgi:hypothetical protein
MADFTKVTITFLDSYGKTTTRGYQSRDSDPSDGDVQGLATKAQALSALSITKAIVTREVDVTGVTTAAEAKSSRQKDASLKYQKSALRNSHAGPYTFNIPEPKAAIVDGAGNIDLADAAVTGWREEFDDGAGIPAVIGDFYVSDGEELVEDQDPLDGFLNKS